MDLHDLDVRLATFYQEFTDFKSVVKHQHEETKAYRKLLCDKVDSLKENLGRLTCGVHDERIKQNSTQIAALWGFVGAIVIAVIYTYIK